MAAGTIKRRKAWGYSKPPMGVMLDDSASINAGLYAWWLMNESSGSRIYELSPNRFTSTLTNPSGWLPGRYGRSPRFVTASSTHVETTITSDSIFTGAANTTFTVSVWFKSNSGVTTADMLIAKQISTGGGGWSLNMIGTTQEVNCVFKGAAGANVLTRNTSTGGLSDGKWHHIAAIFTSNTTSSAGQDIQIYLDGVLNQGTLTNTAAVAAPGAITVKIGARNAGGTQLFFGGQLDNVRIYSRGLRAALIRKLYTDPFAGLMLPRKRIFSAKNPTNRVFGTIKKRKILLPFKPNGGIIQTSEHPLREGLVGHWLLGESGGPRIYDTSIRRNIGTATGTASVSGKFGRCRSFNGSSDFINVGQVQNFTVMTISLWMKCNTGNNYSIAKTGSGAGAYQWAFGYNFANGAVTLVLWQSGGGNYAVATGVGIANNEWHHIAGTAKQGVKAEVFFDGIAVGSTTSFTGTWDTTSTGNINIGRRPDNVGYFNGNMENIRLYNRVLSAGEIWSLYTNPLAGLMPPRKRFWSVGTGTPTPPATGAGIFTPRSGWWGDL